MMAEKTASTMAEKTASTMAEKTASTMALQSLSIWETMTLMVFIFYVIFPIPMPVLIATPLNTSWSILIVIAITGGLFYFSHPVLAVTYIFVAYEMIKRSDAAMKAHLTISDKKNDANMGVAPTQTYKNEKVKEIPTIRKNPTAVNSIEIPANVHSSLEMEFVNHIDFS